MLCYLAGASSPIGFARSWTSSPGALPISGFQTPGTEEGIQWPELIRSLLIAQMLGVVPLITPPNRPQSSEVPASYIQAAQQRRQVMQAPGDQVAHATLGFQRALHHQEPRFQEGAALPLRQLAPDHHVDHAVLVLQRDEGDTTGGLRPLAANHQSGRDDVAPGWDGHQLLRAAAAPRAQLCTQQGHRVALQRGAERGVVRLEILADTRQRQDHWLLT